MNWTGTSEILLGKVLQGELPRSALQETDLLAPPYNDYLRALLKDPRTKASTVIVDKFGVAALDILTQAAESSPNDVDWIEVIRRSQRNHSVGKELQAEVSRLFKGEDADTVKIINAAQRLNNIGAEFKTGNQIEATKYTLRDSYHAAIQRYIPGIPEAGLLVIAGLPKVGKTRLAMDLALAQAEHDENGLIFSFEQHPEEIKAGLKKLRNPSKAAWERLHFYTGSEALTVDGLYARAVQMSAGLDKPPTIIVVDYADYLIQGSADEPKMTQIFVRLAALGKALKCCVVLLAQFNDGAYHGGLPLPSHIRYGRMAVAASTMLWCLYNPHRNWTSAADDARLPPMMEKVKAKGRGWVQTTCAYIIVWTSRFGFGFDDKGRDKDSGAIRLTLTPSGGWGQEAYEWRSLSGISLT